MRRMMHRHSELLSSRSTVHPAAERWNSVQKSPYSTNAHSCRIAWLLPKSNYMFGLYTCYYFICAMSKMQHACYVCRIFLFALGEHTFSTMMQTLQNTSAHNVVIYTYFTHKRATQMATQRKKKNTHVTLKSNFKCAK